jgi:hypothetical protein
LGGKQEKLPKVFVKRDYIFFIHFLLFCQANT